MKIDHTDCEKIHSRTIDMGSYSEGPDHMIFTASLIEKRLTPYYLSTGEKQPAGELHNLRIKLRVKIPEMLIQDIEAEMIEVPREECRDILEAFQKIKGLKIEQGFSSKIKKILGGIEGCTHLVHLLLTLAPAALQGMWTQKSGKMQSGLNPERLKKLSGILIDTCYTWRQHGDAAVKLKNMIIKKEKEVKKTPENPES